MAQPLAIAGLNGKFMPLAEVSISPLDRGFLFADSIYEVIPVYGGTPLLLEAHVARLDRSLKAINIRNPHSDDAWQNLIAELIKCNGGGTMALYIQVSRGVESGRNHAYSENIQPTVFAMATELGDYQYEAGVTAIMLPDDRWKRCDIKSTALLPNILAQRKAAEAGAIDAILTVDGYVTEGAVSSIIIVENEITGILIPPENPEKMINAINNLLDNDLLIDQLTKNAFEFITKNFTWDVLLPKYIELYEK